MSYNIILLVEGMVKTGALEEFKAQMDVLCEVTKADEPDTLNYEWYLGAGNETFQIYERYRNAEAAVKHLNRFIAHYAPAFQTVTDTTKVTVYGKPNETLKQIMDGFGAIYMTEIGGFHR